MKTLADICQPPKPSYNLGQLVKAARKHGIKFSWANYYEAKCRGFTSHRLTCDSLIKAIDEKVAEEKALKQKLIQ